MSRLRKTANILLSNELMQNFANEFVKSELGALGSAEISEFIDSDPEILSTNGVKSLAEDIKPYLTKAYNNAQLALEQKIRK